MNLCYNHVNWALDSQANTEEFMRFILFGCFLMFSVSYAQKAESPAQILGQVYGSISTACTQDDDADTGNHNRLAMAGGGRYLVYCHDGSGSGVACECLQGGSSVDATSAVGITLFANEKIVVKQKADDTHISCVPFVDDQQYEVCRLQ